MPDFRRNIQSPSSGLNYVDWVNRSVVQADYWEHTRSYWDPRLQGVKTAVATIWIKGAVKTTKLMAYYYRYWGVVGSCTMLQAGRSLVRVPDEVDFINLSNPSSRTMTLGSTQPLTEMSTRYIPGSKERPARWADNLASICGPIVWKCGSLNLFANIRASTACTEITLPLPCYK
jgi:hypothetical protein